MNEQPSIKDKVFLNKALSNKVRRTKRVGQCFMTSKLFDEYLEAFVGQRISDRPIMKSITIFYNPGSIIGFQSQYEVGDKLLESGPYVSNIEPSKQVTIEFEEDEGVSEILGYLNDDGCVCGIVIVTTHKRVAEIGGKGPKIFDNIVNKDGSYLIGVGGSFRKEAMDSIYFYYI